MIKYLSLLMFTLVTANSAIAMDNILLTAGSLSKHCPEEKILSIFEDVDSIEYFNGESLIRYNSYQTFESEVANTDSEINNIDILSQYIIDHKDSQVSMVIDNNKVLLKDWLRLIKQAENANIHLKLYLKDESISSDNSIFSLSEQQKRSSSSNVEVLSYRCLPKYAIGIDEIKAKLSELIRIPESRFSRTTDLRTLVLDELDLYEIKSSLAEKYQLLTPIPVAISTLNDLQKHINTASHTRNVRMRGKSKGDNLIKQTVFYGTNRLKEFNGNKLQFGGDRTNLSENQYGSCTITLPKTHKKGIIERPFMDLEFFADESKHVLLRNITPLSQDEFLSQIDRKQIVNGNKQYQDDIVIFVHGFNVTFEAAALRTAQITNDIGFKGAPIFFSWPSDGQLLAYTRDREDAVWSRNYLEKFIKLISKEKQDQDIHLIAHSMGNQVLLGALHQIALRDNKLLTSRFKSIILAAPDFDAELFADQIAPEVAGMSNNWTIYTSDKDAALNISATVNATPRLGQPVTPIASMQVIDATGVEVTPWSVPEFHSYYATKQRVVDDLIEVIKGTPISQRKLEAKFTNGIPYWKLK